MQGFLNAVTGIANESGFVGIMENPGYLIMIIVACGLIYLAIGKQFEPLLLLPIAFGMLLANLPFARLSTCVFHPAGRRGPFAVSDVQRDPAPWRVG